MKTFKALGRLRKRYIFKAGKFKRERPFGVGDDLGKYCRTIVEIRDAVDNIYNTGTTYCDDLYKQWHCTVRVCSVHFCNYISS